MKSEEKSKATATAVPGPNEGSIEAYTGPISKKLTVEPSLKEGKSKKHHNLLYLQ